MTHALSHSLAEFIETTAWSDIPSTVRHEAKRALVNYFAVCLAGCSDPDVVKAVKLFSRFNAGGQGRVAGRSESMDMLNAASLNAMSGNVFDFDDTHMPTILHPTAPVAPALLALAQTQRVSGAELLAAFAVGVDVECRLANAVSPWHYQRGWHITSTCGVFGAAVAAGRLLGWTSNACCGRWAMPRAILRAGGDAGQHGQEHRRRQQRIEWLAVRILAAQGFEGPALPIEGPRGFLKVMGNEARHARRHRRPGRALGA
jgi:2-methylcitrate dehydratase PrpD